MSPIWGELLAMASNPALSREARASERSAGEDAGDVAPA